MQIRIDSNSSINPKDNTVSASNNNRTSFLTALIEVSNNITNTNIIFDKNTFQPRNIILDNLPNKNNCEVSSSIGKLDDIFKIDILGNPDQFYKKDSTINIKRILNLYGNKVTQSDLQDLSKSLTTLRDNGLISDEDYYYALKWIETKLEYFRINMQIEKNKDLIGNLILKHKNNKKDTKN